jgi:hypothetical protein
LPRIKPSFHDQPTNPSATSLTELGSSYYTNAGREEFVDTILAKKKSEDIGNDKQKSQYKNSDLNSAWKKYCWTANKNIYRID